jgi:PASTA domain
VRFGFVGLAVAALAAAWYFGVRPNGTVIPEEAPAVSDVQLRVEEPRTGDYAAAQRVTAFSGLQTTVPDTLGSDERTAARTLEDGGFRVRVMKHKVTRASDEGVVVQQLPRAGVTRRVGWIITIVVGRAG